MIKNKVRVLLIEGNSVLSSLLEVLIDSSDGLEFAGCACTIQEGVKLAVSIKPDLVILHLYPEEEKGARILINASLFPVIVLTSKEYIQNSKSMFNNYVLGILPAPSVSILKDLAKSQRFINDLKLLAKVNSGKLKLASPHLIAIGSSTGAVKVLQEILKDFPVKKNAAILLAHHITKDFGKDFVAWLKCQASYAIKVPEDGERIFPETLYVSPPDTHLCVGKGRTIQLSQDPPVNGFRPSATKLFESIARNSPFRSIGIILSGMGNDGAEGLLLLAKQGGFTIAQDQKTSVVFSMPRVAIKIGAVNRIAASSEIANVVLEKLEEWNR